MLTRIWISLTNFHVYLKWQALRGRVSRIQIFFSAYIFQLIWASWDPVKCFQSLDLLKLSITVYPSTQVKFNIDGRSERRRTMLVWVEDSGLVWHHVDIIKCIKSRAYNWGQNEPSPWQRTTWQSGTMEKGLQEICSDRAGRNCPFSSCWPCLMSSRDDDR